MKIIEISGIYKITNLINNKYYIGSSKHISKRFKQHLDKLEINKHLNIHLQRAFNVYGRDNFKFEIIEECLPSKLLIREQYFIDNSFENELYNICRKSGGGDNISNHPNKIHLIKNRINNLNKWRNSLTFEQKEKLRKNKMGDKNPNHNNGTAWSSEMRSKARLEIKDKLKNFNKKRKGLSIEQLYGKEISDKIKQKFSDNGKKRIGEKNSFFGKHHTDLYKENARKRRIGKYYGNQNIPFMIDGIRYKSLGEASKVLNIHITTIRHRLNSKNKKYTNYSYL